MDKIKFILKSLVVFLGGLYLIYVGYIYCNQSSMVFVPSRLDKNYQFDFKSQFEEKVIPSFDGKKQHGILFRSKKSKGIVFYLHGNAGNVSNWGNIASFYTALDYDLFILDYRSFGKSEGQIENEMQILKDVQIVYDQITKNYTNKVIMGYSIGTGIATQLAAKRKAAMLILQAPYDNFIKFSSTRVPFFPNVFKKFQFETDKKVKSIAYPIVIFHGNKDRLISVENAYRLKKMFKKTDTLYVLNNQDHLGINENPEFQGKLKNLLR